MHSFISSGLIPAFLFSFSLSPALWADEFLGEPQPPFDPSWAEKAIHQDIAEDPESPATDFGQRKQTAGPFLNARRQPQGALSGKIVYTSAGHGWTFNGSSWGLQRPLVSGTRVVEDYGNLDQMSLFARYLWNAGATVVAMRPVGWQENEIILDQDDSEVAYTGTWLTSSSTPHYSVPPDSESYRFADASAQETATARYTPDFPEADWYPVYTWVLNSSNRANQLYRVRHSGGITESRIDHRRVGKGWVWLGNYYFEQGTEGYVEISNMREPGGTGSVVIADAIRFGNGVGRSGFPREEEASRYWAETSTGTPPETGVYDRPGLSDNSDNVGTPPRMAAYMNNESEGQITERVYVGFHSNAGGGRGADGLYNVDSFARPPFQLELADLLGREINEDMRQLDTILFPDYPQWTNKTDHIFTRINFGEQRSDYINDEMSASIIEVAFHDSLSDSEYLTDPRARQMMARATTQAVIRYFNERGTGALDMPPDEPRNLSARRAGDGSGDVLLQWDPPVLRPSSASGTPGNIGGDAPEGYVVYTSASGKDFGFQEEIGDVTSYRYTPDGPNEPLYFYVSARNAGGESFPSNVAGVMPSANRLPVLIVDGYDRFDNSMPPDDNISTRGIIKRPIPRLSNDFSYVIPHGHALRAASADYSFESATNEAVIAQDIDLNDYPVVIWYLGREGTADQTFDAQERALVESYLDGGGALFVSGSEIAWDLGSQGTSAESAFLANFLGASYATDDAGTYFASGTAAGIFQGISVQFDNASAGIYDVYSPDTLNASETAVMNYSGGSTAAATLDGEFRVVYLAFPFESIIDETVRTDVMRAAMEFLQPPLGEAWMLH